jgi:hypothetical protein
VIVRLRPWVQVWVQLKKEKWLPISRKRHQIGHLDFRSFRLLTNLKTVESAPLIPKKRRFSGPSLEPSRNQITGVNPYNETVLSCTRCEARITFELPTGS